ncbi:MAG: hypothetical protein O3B01_18405 [Planctomycetota bacterium]|nr:hypothetical protein [Planctomycetota bacterium]MDA1140545.1 hypothetical protein [Planctomycetota bacterium]
MLHYTSASSAPEGHKHVARGTSQVIVAKAVDKPLSGDDSPTTNEEIVRLRLPL